MEARLSGQKQRMTHLLEFSCAEEVLLLLHEKHRGHFDRCLRLQHELRRALPARGEVGARGGVARRRRRDWRAARRKMLRVRDSGVKAERAGGERLHDEWNRRQRAIVHVRDRNRRRGADRSGCFGAFQHCLCVEEFISRRARGGQRRRKRYRAARGRRRCLRRSVGRRAEGRRQRRVRSRPGLASV